MNIRQLQDGSWFCDLRYSPAGDLGRIIRATKGEVAEEMRLRLAGAGEIEFTNADKLAKRKLIEFNRSATLMQAVEYYLARETPKNGEKLLSAAITECVQAKRDRNRRDAYTDNLEYILGKFLEYMGDVNVSDIAQKHVEGYLKMKPWASSTRHGMRNRLSAFFGFCEKAGYCAKNPAGELEMETVERKRPDIFTVEQTHRLLDTAATFYPSMLPYLTLGIFCGIRPEELQELPNECIHIDARNVEIPAEVSKTRDCRVVDLSDNAIAWLRSVDKPLRFSRRYMRDLIELAQITWSADVMRHTFATYHVALHESADKTALQMGHHGSTRMLFKHYRRGGITKQTAQDFWNIEPAMHIKVLAKAVGDD
jgi:hypothetical protein